MTVVMKTAYLVIIGGPCPVCFITNPHKHRIDPETGAFDDEPEAA